MPQAGRLRKENGEEGNEEALSCKLGDSAVKICARYTDMSEVLTEEDALI